MKVIGFLSSINYSEGSKSEHSAVVITIEYCEERTTVINYNKPYLIKLRNTNPFQNNEFIGALGKRITAEAEVTTTSVIVKDWHILTNSGK